MLVLEGLAGLQRTIQLQLLQPTGWGIDLDYRGIEWYALETSRDHAVVFAIASKYCIFTKVLHSSLKVTKSFWCRLCT